MPSARLAPPRLERAPESLGVGEEEVGGGHRLHELLEVEPQAPLLLGFRLAVGGLLDLVE